jgi:hypothetical protein
MVRCGLARDASSCEMIVTFSVSTVSEFYNSKTL